MLKNKRLITVLTIFILDLFTLIIPNIGSATAIPQTATFRPNIDINLWGDFGIGVINGFEQIPLDGTPGTTSEHKPTFSQLGINEANLFEVGAVMTIKQWLQVDASLQLLRMNSDTKLNEPLRSHGRLFPENTLVSTSSDYNIYHLKAGPIWQISPKMQLGANAGVALLHFNYQITGAGKTASRDFNHLSPEIGVKSNYQLTQSLSWQSSATATVPLQFSEETINTSLHYYPQMKKYPNLSLFVKTGAIFLHFKDQQQEPNEMRVNYGPYIAFGISI